MAVNRMYACVNETKTGIAFVLVDDPESENYHIEIVTACHLTIPEYMDDGLSCDICLTRYSHEAVITSLGLWARTWTVRKEARDEYIRELLVEWASGWTGIPEEDLEVTVTR